MTSPSERNSLEVWAELVLRVDHLARAVLVLANQIEEMAVSYELQQALDAVREDLVE